MKYYNKHLRSILILLFPLLVMGCFSSKYVERKHYLLNMSSATTEKSLNLYSCDVSVDSVTATAPFDQLDFLYRIQSGRYLTDYYNGFLSSPSGQFDAILGSYIKAYGKFNIDPDDAAVAKNRLQVKLLELYADYRNHDRPQAVVTMRFVLTRVTDGKPKILVDKVLRSSVPLPEKNTDSLLAGWNKAARDLMLQGIKLLNRKLVC